MYLRGVCRLAEGLLWKSNDVHSFWLPASCSERVRSEVKCPSMIIAMLTCWYMFTDRASRHRHRADFARACFRA